MKRREIIASAVGIALASSHIKLAMAQNGLNSPLDIEVFAKSISQGPALGVIFTDVEFVHSWRSEKAPRSYENSSEWIERARSNRSEVWGRLRGAGDPGNVVLSQAGEIAAYDKAALVSFEENSRSFQEFLAGIGILADGPAASRIQTSLREYAALNAAVFGNEVELKAKDSFFWPFC